MPKLTQKQKRAQEKKRRRKHNANSIAKPSNTTNADNYFLDNDDEEYEDETD